MATPYDSLPSKAYWRTGVANMPGAQPEGMFKPKFAVGRDTKIATAGSCFAQNFRQAVIDRGYTYLDAEPPPSGFSGAAARRFGFDLFSARYGNIYTVRQLLELIEEVDGARAVGGVVWERDGRYFDAFRPSVEPDGLDSPSMVLRHREQHIRRLAQVIETADVFVFTLGLTEAWMDRASGRIVPVAPGVIAGDYDPEHHVLVNFGAHEVVADLEAVVERLRARNKDLKIILTVSPVPLTATASGEHVFVATCYSKAVLRSAAGWVAGKSDFIDYFPSYEFFSNPFGGVSQFNDNHRTVSARGVSTVMNMFFEAMGEGQAAAPAPREATLPEPEDAGDVVCEDFLLDAFAR